MSKSKRCKSCGDKYLSKFKWIDTCQTCQVSEKENREKKWGYNETSLIGKMGSWVMSPKIYKKEITYLWCLYKLDKIEALEILMIAHIWMTVTNKHDAYGSYSTDTQWRKMLRILYISLHFRHKKLENLIDK
jgi:hypothetical protein